MSIVRLNAGTASNSINSSGGVGHNVANYMWQSGAVATVSGAYTKDTITLDSTTTTGMNGSAASATNTISHTTGSGANRLMTVNFYGNENGVVSGMTYNGISLTKLGSLTLSPNYPVQEIWYLIAPPTGTFNLVVSMSTTSYGGFNITTWSGVDQTTPLANYSQLTGAYNTGGATSFTISAESSSLVYSSFNSWNISAAYGANMTSRWQSGADSWTTRGHTALADISGTTTLTYTLSNGSSTNRWSLLAVIIRANVTQGATGTINLANVSSQTSSSGLNDTTVQFYQWDTTAANQHYNYKVMGFTSNASITFDKKTLVDYICVAGGGGGGCAGGGGGGGGITRGTVVVLPFVEYSIVVGAGGAAASSGSAAGSNGGDTYFIEKNILLNYSSYLYTATNVALGGGGGGSSPSSGAWNAVSSGGNGGNGGGGALANNISGLKYSAPGNGTYRQGFGGGRGCNGTTTATAGGGGGGGAASGGGWANASVVAGGGGGQGLPLTTNTYNDVTGVGTITSQYYGSGGGGGCSATTYAGGPFGTGGTNAANGSNQAVPSNATANCGGGGGGSGNYNYAGSNGGSGVVFLRIRTNSYTNTGDNIPPT